DSFGILPPLSHFVNSFFRFFPFPFAPQHIVAHFGHTITMSRTGIFRRNKYGGDVPPPYHPPEKSGAAPISAAELKKNVCALCGF
ncbi:MAG: hypothetical protein LIO55_07550, partial [Oscillospiraceae bacterium]|nr:hypothetical protein [Oscillospiraceae bacterium]